VSPITHLIGSWIVAAVTTNSPRDRKLVALSGVIPDADGLGLIVDVAKSIITGKENTFHYYQQYHHYLMHGWPGAIVVAALFACFARQKWRVAMLCLLVFHLHLLCDLIGSRGPTPGDIWPIAYSEPLFRYPIWFWKGQWKLDGWQNQIIFVTLFASSLWMAVKRGYSFVEIFGSRLDSVIVNVLRKWRTNLCAKKSLS
jgi:hypothetical protein